MEEEVEETKASMATQTEFVQEVDTEEWIGEEYLTLWPILINLS